MVETYNINEIHKSIRSPKKSREKFNLSENNTFISLDIGSNFISEHLIFKIEELIKPFKNLERIDIEDSFVSERNITIRNLDSFIFVYCNDINDNLLNNQKIPYSLYIKIIDIFSKYKQLEISI